MLAWNLLRARVEPARVERTLLSAGFDSVFDFDFDSAFDFRPTLSLALI